MEEKNIMSRKNHISKKKWRGITISAIILTILVLAAYNLKEGVFYDLILSAATATFLALFYFVLREIFGVRLKG